MPFLAPTPFPTMMATGVASPSAHGQLMTRTETARARAKAKSLPAISQPVSVTRETMITPGTNTADTRSAILEIGALVAAASETSLTMAANEVSSPARSVRQRMNPDLLTVAAATSSPSFLSQGTLSPVSADSSMAAVPLTITPSAGIFCPGFTMKMSPGFSSAMGISVSFPSFSTIAVFGASFIRLLSASVVRPFE